MKHEKSHPLPNSYNQTNYGTEEAVELLLERYVLEYDLDIENVSSVTINELEVLIENIRNKDIGVIINDEFIDNIIKYHNFYENISHILKNI